MATNMRVIWRDEVARRAATEGQKDGLNRASHEILSVSNQVVPLDQGVLMGSGSVDVAQDQATVFYDTPYAVKLHEDRHLQIKGGRRVQYLRKSVTSSRPHILAWFGDAFKIKFSRKGIT